MVIPGSTLREFYYEYEQAATETPREIPYPVLYLYRIIAENPNTPADVLYKLFSLKFPELLDSLTRNINTPSEIIVAAFEYKEDNYQAMRTLIASNPNTPSRILEQIVDTDNPWVKRALTNNRNASTKVLFALLKDDSPEISEKAHQALQRFPEYTGYPSEWLRELGS